MTDASWLQPVPASFQGLQGYVVERNGWYWTGQLLPEGGWAWSRNPLRALVSPYPYSSDDHAIGGKNRRVLLWHESFMLPLRHWEKVLTGRFTHKHENGTCWIELDDGPPWASVLASLTA